MNKTIQAIRPAITLLLNASLSVFGFMGVLPTLQANTEIDQIQIQRIEDIRLRLCENDRRANENQHYAEDRQAEEIIAGLNDAPIPDWPNWSNWGNGWRNY